MQAVCGLSQLFFVMIRRPPRSKLFTYKTLFRSGVVQVRYIIYTAILQDCVCFFLVRLVLTPKILKMLQTVTEDCKFTLGCMYQTLRVNFLRLDFAPLGSFSPKGRVNNNIPTMHFMTRIPKNILSQILLCYHCLSVLENFKMMHCGILFNKPSSAVSGVSLTGQN